MSWVPMDGVLRNQEPFASQSLLLRSFSGHPGIPGAQNVGEMGYLFIRDGIAAGR